MLGGEGAGEASQAVGCTSGGDYWRLLPDREDDWRLSWSIVTAFSTLNIWLIVLSILIMSGVSRDWGGFKPSPQVRLSKLTPPTNWLFLCLVIYRGAVCWGNFQACSTLRCPYDLPCNTMLYNNIPFRPICTVVETNWRGSIWWWGFPRGVEI